MADSIYQCVCGKTFIGVGAKVRVQAMAHTTKPGNHVVKKIQ